MKHESRRFVENLDYLTSPGWLSGGSSRAIAGLSRGGPEFVITSLGILTFEKNTQMMYLDRFYECTTPREIQENTGFELDTDQSKPEDSPTPEELQTLRENVDPLRFIL
jgi:glutaconate CoA-transferase subunit B